MIPTEDSIQEVDNSFPEELRSVTERDICVGKSLSWMMTKM